MHYAAARRARANPLTAAAGLLLLARTSGAFAHAIWLRSDRWRLEMLMQDLRYALRTLTRKPGFALITVLTLALGIGANAAIFSAVRAVLLRPMPFPEPDQLVGVFSTSVRNPDRTNGTVSPPDFTDWRHDSRSFAEVSRHQRRRLCAHGAGRGRTDSRRVRHRRVLQRARRAGSSWPRRCCRKTMPAGAGDVVVIGHGLWSRRFGVDPAIVGRTITFDGVPYRVVGVMPRSFAYPLQSEVWLPQRFTDAIWRRSAARSTWM